MKIDYKHYNESLLIYAMLVFFEKIGCNKYLELI